MGGQTAKTPTASVSRSIGTHQGAAQAASAAAAVTASTVASTTRQQPPYQKHVQQQHQTLLQRESIQRRQKSKNCKNSSTHGIYNLGLAMGYKHYRFGPCKTPRGTLWPKTCGKLAPNLRKSGPKLAEIRFHKAPSKAKIRFHESPSKAHCKISP